MKIIHPRAKVSSLAEIENSVRGSSLNIGSNTVIDSFVKIKFTGGIGDIIIGSSVYINSGCVLYSGNGISIGDNVSIAANVVFAPVNHEFKKKNELIQKQGFKESKGGIIIEDDVWIGAGCVILDGTTLHQGSVIGAMSLVCGDVPTYSVCAGNPMKLLGRRK
jgi:virginiamycin A acetyltransferase